MNMPNDYAQTQVAGDWKPLPAGGQICKIKKVEEVQSSTGKPMLRVSLDIAEGEFKDYFATSYKNDTREGKKWGCVANIVTVGDYGTRNLKTFCSSVEKSNTGFKVLWGEKFAACFKDKLVGVVFRREQYLNVNNELKWSTKPAWFRGTDTVLTAPVPEDKYLANVPDSSGVTTDEDGFLNVNLDDSDLPF